MKSEAAKYSPVSDFDTWLETEPKSSDLVKSLRKVQEYLITYYVLSPSNDILFEGDYYQAVQYCKDYNINKRFIHKANDTTD